MSFICRNNLSYLYCVEQYFLSLTGRGVGLSPLDHMIIKSWETRGVPLNVACAGIKKSIRFFEEKCRLHESPPRSIRYCETLVEKEFIKYKRLKLGAHTEDTNTVDNREVLLMKTDALINRLISVGNKEKDTGILELYCTVCNRIRNAGSEMDENRTSLYAELEEIDRFFMNEFCRLISPEELSHLMQEVKERLSIHKPKMSGVAYKRTLESLRNLLARKRYGLIRIEI